MSGTFNRAIFTYILPSKYAKKKTGRETGLCIRENNAHRRDRTTRWADDGQPPACRAHRSVLHWRRCSDGSACCRTGSPDADGDADAGPRNCSACSSAPADGSERTASASRSAAANTRIHTTPSSSRSIQEKKYA